MIGRHQPCCLVAEDQALISLALEDTLEDAGLAVAGPFASCQEALAWAEEHTPEIAIIDFQLKDGPCTKLAKELRRRGVPVIIYSGYPHGETIPPELDGLPWLEKPTANPISLVPWLRLRLWSLTTSRTLSRKAHHPFFRRPDWNSR
jgi:DNA-binding NtrC family response regulator